MLPTISPGSLVSCFIFLVPSHRHLLSVGGSLKGKWKIYTSVLYNHLFAFILTLHAGKTLTKNECVSDIIADDEPFKVVTTHFDV